MTVPASWRNRRVHAALRAPDRPHGEGAVHGQVEVLPQVQKAALGQAARGGPQRARLGKPLGPPHLAQRQGPLTWEDRRAERGLSEGARLALRLLPEEGAHGPGAPPRLRSRPGEAREGGGPPLRRAVVAAGEKQGGRGNRAGQVGLPDVGRDVALDQDAQGNRRGFSGDRCARLVPGMAAHRGEPPDVHSNRIKDSENSVMRH